MRNIAKNVQFTWNNRVRINVLQTAFRIEFLLTDFDIIALTIVYLCIVVSNLNRATM